MKLGGGHGEGVWKEKTENGSDQNPCIMQMLSNIKCVETVEDDMDLFSKMPLMTELLASSCF